MKQFRNPNDIHAPLAAYSHQVELSPSEHVLVLSGQVGMKKDGSIPENSIEQLRVALDNIHANLLAANMELKDLIKLTIYVVGQMDANERRTLLEEYFKELKPCMTLVFVAALASPSIKVEIDAMASCEKT